MNVAITLVISKHLTLGRREGGRNG
jgi:hypothetical protein